MNVDRLKHYLEKLILLPRTIGKPKKGNYGVISDTINKVELVQNVNKNVLNLPKIKKK